MLITTDCHTHTQFSGDSDASMESMAASAIKAGLHTLCFTEHMDIDYPVREPDGNNIFLLDTDAYLQKVESLQSSFHNRINLLHGVELGIQPQISAQIEAYAKAYPFDFIIASEHVCHNIDPYYPEFYEGRTESAAYQSYFEELLSCVQNYHYYDVVGHIDYVVRYGPNQNQYYSYAKYADVLDEILKTVIQDGKGIEVNSAGFRKGLSAPNPCPDILRRYRELGGEIITVGSDAHSPDCVAQDFDKVEILLQQCGFRYYSEFQKRTPSFIPLF